MNYISFETIDSVNAFKIIVEILHFVFFERDANKHSISSTNISLSEVKKKKVPSLKVSLQ